MEIIYYIVTKVFNSLKKKKTYKKPIMPSAQRFRKTGYMQGRGLEFVSSPNGTVFTTL